MKHDGSSIELSLVNKHLEDLTPFPVDGKTVCPGTPLVRRSGDIL